MLETGFLEIISFLPSSVKLRVIISYHIQINSITLLNTVKLFFFTFIIHRINHKHPTVVHRPPSHTEEKLKHYQPCCFATYWRIIFILWVSETNGLTCSVKHRSKKHKDTPITTRNTSINYFYLLNNLIYVQYCIRIFVIETEVPMYIAWASP